MKDTNLIEDLRRLQPPDVTWVVVGLLGLLLAGTVAWAWLRRGPRPTPAPPAGPPAWELALAELEALVGLLRPEASRDYGTASTAVLRRYIEQCYGLSAPRQATEEFLAAAASSTSLPAEHRESLARFLRRGDLCKFGRFTATAAELAELHATAVAFVLASAAPQPSPGGLA